MVSSKELVLFIMRLIETFISLEAQEFELSLVDKKLILNVKQKKYNVDVWGMFVQYYNSEVLSELFENQITKIEIKS